MIGSDWLGQLVASSNMKLSRGDSPESFGAHAQRLTLKAVVEENMNVASVTVCRRKGAKMVRGQFVIHFDEVLMQKSSLR